MLTSTQMSNKWVDEVVFLNVKEFVVLFEKDTFSFLWLRMEITSGFK